MIAAKPVSASMEDYLEAIYQIVQEKKVARSKEISKELGVTNASVTGALRVLSERNLINYAPYELITLTGEGNRLAENVVQRHSMLKEFFISVLGIDEEEAGENACKMEHVITENLQQRLIRFIEFVNTCSTAGGHWIEEFRRYLDHPETGRSAATCRECMSEVQE